MNKRTVKIVEDTKTEIFSTEGLSYTPTVKSSPQYPYISCLYSSAWWGYLYGQETVTEGPTRVLNISAGTKWTTAISTVLAVALPGSTAVGILVALGVTAISVTIDYGVSGKIWAKFYRTDYEVWSQGELGLVTYQTKVYQKVVSTSNGNVEELYVRTDGFSGTRNDMIHQGIYTVYMFG